MALKCVECGKTTKNLLQLPEVDKNAGKLKNRKNAKQLCPIYRAKEGKECL